MNYRDEGKKGGKEGKEMLRRREDERKERVQGK